MSYEPILKNGKRTINYLRLSITDRCNLRCMYCMPEEGVQFVPHGEILSYEEMLNFARIAIRAGIRKIRLTGGEPLVRKGFIPFIESLSRLEGLTEITLTTNGVLLKEYAPLLKKSGIGRLNISLDSLKADRFAKIAGRNCFEQVWEGIQMAEALGFHPIKLNMVAMKGINDDEILDFARLSFKYPYHVRFIEFMPLGPQNNWTSDRFISTADIKQQLLTLGTLHSIDRKSTDGPAERYVFEGSRGEVGLIGALSNHFCDQCNRLRLTADGNLRGCLLSDREIDIKSLLREGIADDRLLDVIKLAVQSKPQSHGLIKSLPRKCIRRMSSIGG